VDLRLASVYSQRFARNKMSTLENAIRFEKEGYFQKALIALEEPLDSTNARTAVDVFKAHLLERIGRCGESRALLNRLSGTRGLTPAQRSMCEFTFGRLEWEEGDRRAALVHFNEAVALASNSSDLAQKCWPLMSVLLAVSHSAGSSTIDQMLSSLRADVFRTGDTRVLAGLHETLGRLEGKRGLQLGARSHLRRARKLLATAPNVYLDGLVALDLGVIAALELRIDSAIEHTQRSLQLAEQSGCLRLQRASLANLAFCFYSVGDFGAAVGYLEQAESILQPSGDTRNAMLETLARIRLAEGSLDECSTILAEIEGGITTLDDKLLWAQRHAALTRTRLMARQGLYRDALRQAERTLEVARRSQDHFLSRMLVIEKSHILQQLKRLPESLELLKVVLELAPNEMPELYAEYETLLSRALLMEQKPHSAEVHLRRAQTIFHSLRHQPGLSEVSRRWSDNVASAIPTTAAAHACSDPHYSAANAVQAVAILLRHSARPELLARGLVDLVEATHATYRAVATTGPAADRRVLVGIGAFDGEDPQTFPKRICISSVQRELVDIWIDPKEDADSIATINAIATLVSTIGELELGRLEREDRMRLWPIEDVDVMNDQAIINGRIRDLMAKARRVAGTKMIVLLTGESGTGKEIFARAIHTFSDRSAQPFVPFNCAALPRDMVETQLFGHRRGAFTGADRDNLGVIRSARGGTLFLDEIGELSIDLQPKLLRFLESGEICPLGETTPFTVDVRIVAATNARLEQAVRDGRFREDLFYRLNGVRLEIPPLRERRDELPSLVHHFLGRAAIEFKKGHVRIAEETMERLLLAPWPGNIRQLQNELRRMVALAEPDAILTPAALSAEITGADDDTAVPSEAAAPVPTNAKLNSTLERIEREMVRAALHQHRGKMDDAAKALGISRKGLYLKRQRLGL
jgi:DNA-binding NtrC family response regulator/tetratricopeptide (TPR) repeat protein